MKAMILAGGMSTRLYPLTRQVPKPLVPIAGEAISAHLMRWLRSFGIEEVVMNVHYLADEIRARFGDGAAYGLKLTYLYEETLMGSAGSLKTMQPFFGDGPFVVVGCDDLTDANLDSLVQFHKKQNAIATIGLVRADEVDQYGVVITDKDGRIVEFQEKPPKGTERSKLVNTGIYVFGPEIFDRIPADTFYDFGKNVFPALQAENAPFYGLQLNGAYWRDIGTLDEYRRATNDVLSGKITLRGVMARGISKDAHLGNDAHIDGDVHVGANVHLGDRVRIVGPSVIGDGVRIGDDAVIERSILWDDAVVGARAIVRDSVVGIDYTIAADTTLADKIVANGEPVAS